MSKLDLPSIDLKYEIDEILKNDPGKQRGGDIKYSYHYVLLKAGEDGMKKIIAEMKKAGYEMPNLSVVDDMDFVPSSLPTIFMLTAAKVLGWQDQDLIDMGKGAVSLHALPKLFIRYFSSVKKTFTLATHAWRKHYTFGDVKIEHYDEKNKRVIVRISHFKKHPVTCLYLQGFFSKVLELATGSLNVTAEETKCEFAGDSFHEYVLSW